MSIFEKYDLIDVSDSIDIPKKPKSGVVVVIGSSGSGKTTILKDWGMADCSFDDMTPIISLFDSEEEGERCLISAGLRSVPCWRRPLSGVSNGERHRAEVALTLSLGGKYIDEFTSLVDRHTARSLCASINKQKIKDMVFATCHRDVLQWLDFDHAYDADASDWIDRGSLRRSRAIKIDIAPCETEAVWKIFKKHHYLSGKVNRSANSWVALYEGKPVAMTSVISFPSGNWKNGWRGHRTVVLPEFQGMGIGSAMSDCIAEHITSTGARFFSKTSHPAFGAHREKSKKWRPTTKNKVKRKDYMSGRKTKEDGHKMNHANRVCFSHEYVNS